MAQNTPQTLLENGIPLLRRHGYHDLGITALLESTGTPKGSFYHHFASKEDYVLQVIELFMQDVDAGLAQCLGETDSHETVVRPAHLARQAGSVVELDDHFLVHGVGPRVRVADPAAFARQLDHQPAALLDRRPAQHARAPDGEALVSANDEH